MNREDQLKKINEIMSNKKIEFGCKVKYDWKEWIYFRDTEPKWLHMHILLNSSFNEDINNAQYIGIRDKTLLDPAEVEIIGAPVFLNDVILFLSKNSEKWIEPGGFENVLARVVKKWKNMRKPIEFQTDECIDYVYWLL